ncbi:MAG: AbrB/MazE/SpoVT family DNA-binding domain-containing protein [Pirellulales bacterium]|nr:AbrB/MazE/SpoVT family DNA-binding domain-containing protein [Pirellulales bacterium]
MAVPLAIQGPAFIMPDGPASFPAEQGGIFSAGPESVRADDRRKTQNPIGRPHLFLARHTGRIELLGLVQAQLGVKPGDELTLEEENGKWFLEHFSQAFARSFMRVGLPSSVPEFW